MPLNNLYHIWNNLIRQLGPIERITCIWNFIWLIIGIHKSHSVTLSRVAGKTPGEMKLLSLTVRLLANPAIVVRDWYEPVAREWEMAQTVSAILEKYLARLANVKTPVKD